MAPHQRRAANAAAVTALAVVVLLAGACTAKRDLLVTPTTPVATQPPVPTPAPTTTPPPTAKPTPKPTRTQPATNPPVKYSAQGAMRTTGNAGVALSFDDGPDPVNTPKILDLLRAQRVKATFCLVGTRVLGYPALVKRIAAEGHTFCNHSWQHRMDLARQTDAYILADLNKTNAAIRRAVPNAKIGYFRAPGGNFTPHLVALAKSLGMKSLYWSVDPKDWDSATYGHGPSMVNHIIYSVEHNTRPGSIVLSHDMGKPDTITAYRTLLPWLKGRFKLIPLPV